MGAEKSVTRNTNAKLDGGITEFRWIFSLRARRNQSSAQGGRIFPFMVLLPPVVFAFGFVNQRAASKACRSAARVLAADGWSARRIRIDRKASVPSDVPPSRPNSVLGTPKNEESDFPFSMPNGLVL